MQRKLEIPEDLSVDLVAPFEALEHILHINLQLVIVEPRAESLEAPMHA